MRESLDYSHLSDWLTNLTVFCQNYGSTGRVVSLVVVFISLSFRLGRLDRSDKWLQDKRLTTA